MHATPDLPPPDYDQLKLLLDGSESMSVGEAMGAFVAVHSMPSPIPAARWLPVVLRERGPADVPKTTLSALLDLYQIVGAQLEDDGMVVPEADDPRAVKAFCTGYAAILGLDTSWIAAPKLAEFHVTMQALGDETVFSHPELETREKRAWLADARRDLGKLLEDVYFVNRGRRPGSAQPIPLKVERNAPCPCGSGRKFKKCCGAA